VTCREPDLGPAEIEVGSDGGRCRLSWHFHGSQAPTFRCLCFDSWADVVADHRRWMQETSGVRPVAEVAPAWLANCPLMVYLDIETVDSKGLHHDFDDVARLASSLTDSGAPANTTVYLTSWNHGGERRWPTYEPSEPAGGLESLQRAADALHARGFRLMLHANVWGASPTHPEYTSLISSTVHNRAGHPLRWREFHGSRVSEYFYVRPNARAFRELFWGSLRPLVETLQLDALYLDQAGLLVDDPSADMLSATRQLIDTIRADAPDLVLGGQVLTSRLCDVIPLWQLWGTPWSGQGWGQPFRRRSPLIADLFRGFTRFCGHIHLPAAVPGRYLWTHEGFANDLGLVGCFLAAQEDNTYHGAIPSVRLNFREHGIDALSSEVIQQAARLTDARPPEAVTAEASPETPPV
ncbi:MAG: hypothetical protein HUU35_19470, partial [Armatimonadetes bacterium]|nr:hypothetical protein [Armatimonadota bacterium]